MVTVESLLPYAARVAQMPRDENARSNLVVRLQVCSDAAVLRGVAARYPFDAAVAIPIWRRIAAVEQDNPQAQVEAAGVMYGLGMDDLALEYVQAALAINDNFLPAWEVKAALTADTAERRRVYEQILKIDPGNRTAVDNLIVLGRPKT